MTTLPLDLGNRMASRLPYLAADARRSAVAGVPVAELVERYGTPLVTYVPQRVTDNLASVKDAFLQRFEDVAVHYAVKACYFPTCLRAARAAGAGVEVMSSVELQMAEQLNFTSGQIIFNGLGRDADYVQRTVDHPRALNVLDTWMDYHTLSVEAARRGTRVHVAIRVVPPLPELPGAMPLDSKLGNYWDSKAFWRLHDAVVADPYLELRGLHAHLFTHGVSVPAYRTYIRAVAGVVRALLDRTGRRFDVIDIGGGFETRARMETLGVTIDDFAAVAAEELAPVPYPFRLVVEPGRYAVADAAVGISRVVAQKDGEGFTWQLVDLATNLLIPIMDYPVLVLPERVDGTVASGDGGPARALAGTVDRYSRVGDGTCAPSVICDRASLPGCDVGSVVALLDVGGYTTVFAHVWGPNPPTVLAVGAGGRVDTLVSPDVHEQVVQAVYGYDLALP